MKYLCIFSIIVGTMMSSTSMAYEIYPAKNRKKEKIETKKKVEEPKTSETVTDNSAEGYYNRGRAEYLKYTSKGYKEAISLFDKALAIDKKYALALASRAQAKGMLSRVIYQPKNGVIRAKLELEAYHDAFIATELEPNLSDAHKALSMIYFVQERYQEGKDEATKSIKLNDHDGEAYLMLWLNSPDKEILKKDNYKSSNYYKALDLNSDLIDKALELEPESVLTYIELGVACANQDKYFQAIKYYNKALEINPESEEAYTYLGFVYNNGSDYNSAIENFNEALKIEPLRMDAIYGLGTSYLRKRDKDTALKYFEKACDNDYRDACEIENNLSADLRARFRGRRGNSSNN